MRLTKDEEKMLSGEYGQGYKKAMEILVQMGEFYDAKRMIPISMAYLVEGPSAAVPGATVTWLNEMADAGVTFKCPLCLAPIEGSTFSDYDLQKRLGAVFAFGSGGHARNPSCLPVRGQHIAADGTADPLYELLHRRQGQHRVLHRAVLGRDSRKNA